MTMMLKTWDRAVGIGKRAAQCHVCLGPVWVPTEKVKRTDLPWASSRGKKHYEYIECSVCGTWLIPFPE